MGIQQKVAKKASVLIHKDPDGLEDYVCFEVHSPDGKPLTGQQIVEAISEALIIHWEYMPMEKWDNEDFNA